MQAPEKKLLRRAVPLISMIFAIGLFFGITSSHERAISKGFAEAIFFSAIGHDEFPITLPDESGNTTRINSTDLVQNREFQNKALITLLKLSASILMLFCFWFFCHLLLRTTNQIIEKKKAIKADKDRIIEGMELRQSTQDKACSTRLSIAGIPLPGKCDTTHIILTGSAGSGKTMNIKEILGGIRKARRKAVIYDVNGEFISHFYRPGKDIILNPMDARSASWDIWCECRRHHDYVRMATALIPEQAGENDWSIGSRLVLAHLAEQLAEEGTPSTEALINRIEKIDSDTIYSILQDTEAAALVAIYEEKACISIRGHLLSCVEPLKELSSDSFRFSVRRWAFNENDDSCLFIGTHSDEMDILRPLMTVWLEFAASTLCSLPADHLRRTFYVVDDINTLNRIPSLENLVLQSRKIGTCAVLSMNSTNRFNELYGLETTQTITRSCESWVALHTNDHGTANWISTKLGFRQTVEKTEVSYNHKDEKQTTQRQLSSPIVTPNQIINLAHMQGFLRFTNQFPVARFTSVARSWPNVAPAFIPRNRAEDLEEGETISKTTEGAVIERATIEGTMAEESTTVRKEGDTLRETDQEQTPLDAVA
ncbi:MAG: type IV secretion system DNA-binding domain-containing protein [Endozoicomonas sp.]